MRRPNVCFQGQWYWSERYGRVWNALVTLSLCLHSTHTYICIYIYMHDITQVEPAIWALHMCLVSPSSFMNINLKRLVFSMSSPGSRCRGGDSRPLININELWNGDWLTPALTGLHHTRLPLMFIHYLEREYRERLKVRKRLEMRGCYWTDWRFTLGLCLQFSDRWS